MVIERPSGERLHVLAHARPIYSDTGEFIGALNVLVDITEQKRKEEQQQANEARYRELIASLDDRVRERTLELDLANETLAALNAELRDFAHVASHDLHEPLRKFRTFLDLLKSEIVGETEDVADYIQRMDASADRMSALLDALLEFSRVNTRGEQFRPTDVAAAVNDVVADLEDRIGESGRKSCSMLTA
jgi:light-regulated signal transduction histidine kinase (bacteriophytochrome)